MKCLRQDSTGGSDRSGPGTRRILMFQTDGCNVDSGSQIGALSREIVNGFDTTSYAIVVGEASAKDRVRDIVGAAGRHGENTDAFIMFIDNYDKLQEEAVRIATKLSKAT